MNHDTEAHGTDDHQFAALTDWWIYRGSNKPDGNIGRLPAAPPWRQFRDPVDSNRGMGFQAKPDQIEMVNAALYLRRPLLITGKPGVGKTSLAYAVADELNLGPVLRWSITTRSTLQSGLYSYDAVGRLQEVALYRDHQNPGSATTAPVPDIGRFLRLGPLGTALVPRPTPRVLLIDEIDKSDIDLPSDLLHIFEEGTFTIPELERLPKEYSEVKVQSYDRGEEVTVVRGRIRCTAFPFVVLTSNGEREFPPAFLRRCLRLEMRQPDRDTLGRIVAARLNLDPAGLADVNEIIRQFFDRRKEEKGDLATDQLLNAIYLALNGIDPLERDRSELLEALWRTLNDFAVE